MRLPFLLLFLLLSSLDINAEEIMLRDPKIGNTDIKFSDFGGSATVITEQDIEASGATEIHQLLREVPGLSVKRLGARGGMISIFARGSESDHNLVLIDGVKANEIGGAFNFEFLSLNNIEKIEILRGPQAALYGAGAIGSVISITTKKPEKKTNISFKSAFGFNQGPKKDSNGLLKDSHTDGGKFFVNEQYFSINGPISKNNESDVFLGYSLGFERINDDGYRRLGSPIPLLQLKVGYYLTDMTEEGQGNLCLIPGSHKSTTDPDPEVLKRKDLFQGAIQVCAPAGTAVLFHNALWHSGGPWSKPDGERVILYYAYEHPWMIASAEHWGYKPDFYNRLPLAQRKLFHGFVFDPPEYRWG